MRETPGFGTLVTMAQQKERPNILQASSNVRKMKMHLSRVLTASELAKIEGEIRENTAALYRLGKSHYYFARRQTTRDWRQKVSRLYYGALNARRAVNLFVSGVYSTDSSDHKAKLPDGFPSKDRYDARIRDLREDRNLADYDHIRSLGDLLYTPSEHEHLVREFLGKVKLYLNSRNVGLK